MTSIIKNYNMASQGNYKLEVPGASHLNYFVQMVTLPTLTMQGIETINLHRQAVMPRKLLRFFIFEYDHIDG